MPDAKHTGPRLANRLIEFLVLALAFFVSSLLLSIEIESGLLFQMLAYSIILLLSVNVARKVTAGYRRLSGSISMQIAGNGAGIIFGTGVMLLLAKIISTSSEQLVALVISSIMAFFILGTLSPLFISKTHSH